MVTMDEDTSKLYIQNLEEYVLDEAKTVTYKWLSRELNLHVNLAKQLLHTFLNQHKVVHATYLLSGLLKDEVTHKILIVQEEDLEKAKLQFKILSSEHVYSVQKSKKMDDLNSLYIIDRYSKDDSDVKRFCNKMNAVRCNDAVERAADEIARLKLEVRACAASTDVRAWQTAKKKTTTEDNKENGTVATTAEEKVGTKKEEKKMIKSGGIAAMFAAQGVKSVKQENIAEKSKANGKPTPNSKNCIVMFLNKNAEKPKEKSKPSVSVVAKDENKCEELVNDESKSSESKVSTKGRSKSEPVRKEKKVGSLKHSTGKANKRKRSDDPPSRKRKRILYVSDSEDSDNDIFGSDNEEEEEEEEEAQNSPLVVPECAEVPMVESDEEVIAPTPQSETKPGRKRERKLKVSTFMDEDGYVVTKREYVVESCTDSEGEEKEKKMKIEENNSETVKDEKNSSTSEPPAKKKCSPQKVKQATLMNFFKRK